LILIGEFNLGGSIEPVLNAVNIFELAVEKGAQSVLLTLGWPGIVLVLSR